MKTKHLVLLRLSILLLFIFAFFGNADAQASYIYDENGNRTATTIVVTHSAIHHNDSTANDSNPCITVYPVPTTSQVNVSIPCIQNCEYATIYMTDASGNLLSTQKQTSTVSPVNMVSYNQGIYYLRIVMCNSQYSYKVVKLNSATGNPSSSRTVPVMPVQK